MNRLVRALLAVAAAFLTAACTTVQVDTPTGFAVYETEGFFHAVSPEGANLRVRSAANSPKQDLAFWGEALNREMQRSGYVLAGEADFSSAEGPGLIFEWLAPVGEEDWLYLTGLVVAGDTLLIAEAAAPVATFQRYRAAIYESLESISLGS